MSGQQTAVGAIGGGLVLANFWLSQKSSLTTGLLGSPTAAQSAAAKTALRDVALEVLFVGGATLIAGTSAQAGNALVFIMVALAIIFAIHYQSTKPVAGTNSPYLGPGKAPGTNRGNLA